MYVCIYIYICIHIYIYIYIYIIHTHKQYYCIMYIQIMHTDKAGFSCRCSCSRASMLCLRASIISVVYRIYLDYKFYYSVNILFVYDHGDIVVIWLQISAYIAPNRVHVVFQVESIWRFAYDFANSISELIKG